ncbi:MAG: glycoside hydrolase family 16 protein [Hyphomicrobiaceae bacterium]
MVPSLSPIKFLAALLAALTWSVLASTNAAAAEGPATLDLTNYRLVFDEDFDKLDVSEWGPGTRWIAHTPWNGDFGDSKFSEPTPGFPFTTTNGVLSIEARKGDDGKWKSGLLASVDRDFNGFSQKYGYFEMRAKLPRGKGLWSAFWLIGKERSTTTAEIDVIEHYGHKPTQYSTTVHVWDRTEKAQHRSEGSAVQVQPDSLYTQFNTFGVRIDPETIRFYLNRKQVWETPTPPEHQQEHYVLLNLAMGPGWPIDETPNHSKLLVDYVRVWALPEKITQKPSADANERH